MNTKRKLLVPSLLVCLMFAVGVAIHAQQSAGVQMAQPGADVSSGKALVLEVKLDKPLPVGSSVIARVGPEGGVAQIIQLESAMPDDASRTKLTLRTTLPPSVVVGKWNLQNLFVTLPGSIQWQQIDHNQLTFEVKGTALETPSKAEVKIEH